jgi:hypothetical protein
MSEPISGIAGSMMQNAGGAAQEAQKGQNATRSFESLLQQGGEQKVDAGVGQPAQISGAELEQMRLDLVRRTENLPAGESNLKVLVPELLDTRTRMGLLNEALQGVQKSPNGVDLRGRFSQVEQEWYQLEGIMKSNKDLSMGELLSLQARLYQVSQHVEVMSKVVYQVTGGVKTILNTNV